MASGSVLPSSGNKKKTKVLRARERANMSFFIVVIFFAVFGVIVLTEIFLIDERGKGISFRHSSLNRKGGDKGDYDDSEDYLAYARAGADDPFGYLKSPHKESNHLGRNPGGKTQGAAGISDPDIILLTNGKPLTPEIERSLPGPPPNVSPTDGVWTPVGKTRYKFFVFSAYYDRREKRYVRVIAATKTRGPERVWCRMFYANTSQASYGAAGGGGGGNTTYTSVTVLARIKVIRENWNLKYSACFILCPIRKELGAPYAVSIVNRIKFPPVNFLRIRNTDQDPDFLNRSATQIPNKMAVCVKPIHYHYDQSLHMLEFLEMYTILGMDHFYMYNHTLGKHVSCILKHYEALGKVTLLPWNLDMVSQKETRTECQFAAFNDCLYRSMYRYSHVALVDLDEFIFPKHNNTLPEMLKWLSTRLNTWPTGSYSFQNAFFYLQWGDDPSIYVTKDKTEAGLITMRKTRRRSKLHPHKQRSKYICRPELVIEAGNHFVWEFLPGHGTLNVPPDCAILHHYRVCEFGGDDCVKTASIVDRTAYKYKPEIVDKVRHKYNELRDKCELPDLPPVPTAPPIPRKKILTIKANKSNKDKSLVDKKYVEKSVKMI